MNKKTGLLIGLAAVVLIAGFGIFALYPAMKCFAGGGYAEPSGPGYSKGGGMSLHIKLGRTGAPECMNDHVTEHFKDAQCHYRLKGGGDFTAASMSVMREEKDYAIYECPVSLPTQDLSQVEYYFDYKFDGVYNRVEAAPKR